MGHRILAHSRLPYHNPTRLVWASRNQPWYSTRSLRHIRSMARNRNRTCATTRNDRRANRQQRSMRDWTLPRRTAHQRGCYGSGFCTRTKSSKTPRQPWLPINVLYSLLSEEEPIYVKDSKHKHTSIAYTQEKRLSGVRTSEAKNQPHGDLFKPFRL